MALLQSISKVLLILVFVLAACSQKVDYIYKGQIECSEYPELHHKKIFIDPGHGGQSKTDKFRISRHGESEGEINLRVALILYDMLKKAGAQPILSRYDDVDIGLDERVNHIAQVEPDLLVSIHHNGSVRPADGVNYATIFMHGTKGINPQSYDFAELLKAEFAKVTGLQTDIVSDYAIFNESGMKILRLTRNICPGVIGEFGFFSDKRFSLKLKDINFNTIEAEAYFRTISEYFKRGVPSALLEVKSKRYYLRTHSGNNTKGIKPGSLHVTIDDVKLDYTKISEDVYRIETNDEIFPGAHRFNIQFKNTNGQSSPLYYHVFRKTVSRGDYDMLVKDGTNLIKAGNDIKKVKRGTKMLLSALSMGASDPAAKNLMLKIAEGFHLMGDMPAYEYYYQSANSFYPNPTTISTNLGFPIKYYGKKIKLK